MKNNQNKFTRRRFILTSTGVGATLLLNPFSTWANAESESEVATIVARTIGIDTHNHLDVPFTGEAFMAQKYDLAVEMRKSGLSAICMTFQVDRPDLTRKGEAYERFITCLDEMDEILKKNDLKRALNLSDLKAAKKENKPVVIQSVEGGHFIEDKLERLEIAYSRGVRHLGLLHDNQSHIPLGDIYTDAPQFGGLTETGMKVIRECNRLGILIDLTHCSNESISDALAISTKPMLVSHTGLNTQLGNNEKMAKMMMPRLISKEQAKVVANAGSVIGVWTHLADTPMQYAQNIRALADWVGTEHVCIGTDTKMAVRVDSNERPGSTTNAAWKEQKEGFYFAVVDALLKAGFNEKEIEQIGGGNYCRIFDAATRH
jgi:membrane dipeptidase